MRSFVNGTLREGPMPNYPPLNSERVPLINPPPPQVHRLVDPERLFRNFNRINHFKVVFRFGLYLVLGDPRINENPPLLSFGLMFYRWHNYQARQLQAEHPTWNDEQLFDRARRMVIATLQVCNKHS